MDYILEAADNAVFDSLYPSSMPRDDIWRQTLSLFIITNVGGALLYLTLTTFSYFFIFDHRMLKHPLILPNQVALEIKCALGATPLMAIPTTACFVAEVRGYSMLYDDVNERGYGFMALSFLLFLLFTDCAIYWIHRWLHHKLIYKHLHKLHHKWKVPTPFASHAFHPIDGFMQSLPYHMFPFIFPLHKGLYLGLFIFVNVWSVMIHDADYRVPKSLQPIINGSAHHTDHHLKFTCNYGEYFTLWDRIGGSFRNPSHYEHEGVWDQLREFEKTGRISKDPLDDQETRAARAVEDSKKGK